MDDDLGLVGRSDAIARVRDLIRRYGPCNDTILILGETGTGKELVARAVHSQSLRTGKAYKAANMAAIPSTLIDSELFGHEKGAFTDAIRQHKGLFEQADGGTLFLDEIGDLSLDLQAHLLRVIQEKKVQRLGSTEPEKPVDVRLVAATNVDLQTRLAQGGFRQDLYYRLNVLLIKIPPLRDREDDVDLLTAHFLGEYAREKGIEKCSCTDPVKQALREYGWPGNVRELQSALKRAFLAAFEEPSQDSSCVTVDERHLDQDERTPRLPATTYAVTSLIDTAYSELEAGHSPLLGLRNSDKVLGPFAQRLLTEVLAEAFRRFCEGEEGEKLLEPYFRGKGSVQHFDHRFYDSRSSSEKHIFRCKVEEMVRQVLDDLRPPR